ncbi:hypothetical protein DMN91_007347 [Ooceraea biroi]|uniref:Uncharacterized protein n=1 Tax=Ooceraea biroi TaxID=2015173 RepID=A0A3L8DJW1_OOCBI|nr:hypothetical protein DMN91_007347 [Ooceraea biroi]
MACYNFVLSSSDDEDIIPHYNRRERRFKELVNYFEVLDELEFKMRFRLSKQTVLLILEQIREELVFLTNRIISQQWVISVELVQLLHTILYIELVQLLPDFDPIILDFQIQKRK